MNDERNERNAIFGAPQAPQPGASNVRQAMGIDIPTEIIPLPSKGKIYPVGHALHMQESVEIRPMTTREEDILTNRALIKTGKVVTALIKSCLVNPDIVVQDMIAADRNVIMTAIRITGYGPEYTGELTCSECEAKFEHEFDLSSLPINELKIDPVALGTNEFAFILPRTKRRVTFKFLTGRDEEDIAARQETLKKKGINQDNAVTQRLMYSILSVEGIADRSGIVSFINNMPARDSLALRRYIDMNEPGVEMKQTSTCTACSHVEEVTVPMGVNFFWPNTSR
jgi:hypothetical protein